MDDYSHSPTYTFRKSTIQSSKIKLFVLSLKSLPNNPLEASTGRPRTATKSDLERSWRPPWAPETAQEGSRTSFLVSPRGTAPPNVSEQLR